MIKVLDIDKVKDSYSKLDSSRGAIDGGDKEEKNPERVGFNVFVTICSISKSVQEGHVGVVVVSKEDAVVDAVPQFRREPDDEDETENVEQGVERHTHQPMVLMVFVDTREKRV